MSCTVISLPLVSSITVGPSRGDLMPRHVESADIDKYTTVPRVWYLWRRKKKARGRVMQRWGQKLLFGMSLNNAFIACQWFQSRCRIELLNFSLGFNIIALYMEMLHIKNRSPHHLCGHLSIGKLDVYPSFLEINAESCFTN